MRGEGVEEAAVRGGVVRLPLDERAEVEEFIDGAWQPQRAGGAEAEDLAGGLEEPHEVGVVEVGYGDGEAPEPAGVAFEADSNREPPLLHLGRPLLLIELHTLTSRKGKREGGGGRSWFILCLR